MKFEVSEKKKNPLMKREEATILIDHRGKATPDRASILAEVANLLKSRPENIIVERITTPGGSTKSVARVLAYNNKDDIPEWRLKKMEQRLSKLKKTEKTEGESPKAVSYTHLTLPTN